ncbi:Rieske 2Fe-2S domain-containing protein [Chondromyces crocatus]|uniref:(2Fe-2S)-binding protein n=1 Tax=Chondromyces crocatus TaxID=52 RepID=A0A0K1EQI6_CHOCO|nr:Rieske 2Fe-2S domain-containing protein [Chondromyces crocatus]AKT43096.1 (2Fe-2S)-binding protein [Chondromyces crocatus]
MGEIDHWHPVLRSDALRTRPVGVRLAGHEIVLFRAEDGALGALEDRCPHRGMRLSLGRVEGARLVCSYHGWRWSAEGRGESPGTPAMRPCARRYDVAERHGMIWVKRAGVTASFPYLEVDGWFEVGRLSHRAQAPLEVVLDNFTEVEHTPSTHLLLGYPAGRMAEVETRVAMTDEAVHVHNEGPQRKLPRVIQALFGIPDEARFVDSWITRFSPVHCVYDQYWLDPVTGERAGDALRIAVFFNPLGPEETEIVSLAYASVPPWRGLGLGALHLRLTRALVDVEVRRDCAVLAGLADKQPGLVGRALGRFDSALVASRRRIARIYRGEMGGPGSGEGAPVSSRRAPSGSNPLRSVGGPPSGSFRADRRGG